MTDPNDNSPQPAQGEFDENRSQGAMPRRYEHIDRVDLWIMAQRQMHAQLSGEIARLREILSYLPKVPTQPYEKEMAREIERLKTELAEVSKVCDENLALANTLGNRAERYRQVLEFYANPTSYEECVTLGGTRPPGVLADGGNKARKALSAQGAGEGTL